MAVIFRTYKEVMTESFLRQRRNLFIINGVLLFSFMAKVNIDKLTIAGLSFNGFEKPEVIFLFIWTMYFYFLYRYFVYFLEYEKDTALEKWNSLMASIVDEKIRSIVDSHSSNVNARSISGYYQIKRNNMIVTFQSDRPEDESNPYSINNHELKLKKRDLILPQLSSLLRYSFLTSMVTSYVLPFIVSVYVLSVAGFSIWEGALFP